MKKFVTFLVILTMLLPATASCSGLADAQKYFYNTAPQNLQNYSFTISGTIVDTFYTKNFHKVLLLTVEDDEARTGITYDYDLPCCKATFPYHREFEMPIGIGEQIEITGTLNCFYSTVMVPDFTIQKVNGVDVSDWLYDVTEKEDP